MNNKKIKGFLIAGANSGIGKTTVSIGLMSLFKDVSPFKIGPDYIDGKFHEFITKNKSYNLDPFLMGEDGMRESFMKHRKSFSILEGVMGLYDGKDNSLDNGGSAHVARILGLPVILVVDGVGKSTSIAAQVMGYLNFDKRVNIIGVIINKVSSEKTYEIFKEAIEKYCDTKCLGYIKKLKDTELSSRHLGLVQADEVSDLKEKISLLQEEMKSTIDLDEIYRLSDISIEDEEKPSIFEKFKDRYKGLRMGIARDKAFSFYYNDNLEFLENLGINITYFSPMSDEKIPDVDILYFGGGYPEIYGRTLEENKSMIESIRAFHEEGGVIYGECGGFIYLSKKLITLEGEEFNFVNLTDNLIEMRNRLNIKRFGYINLKYNDKLVGRGHEFHYSGIKEEGKEEKKFKIVKPNKRSWECGYEKKNTLCGYPHIHFFKSYEILFELLDKAKKNKEKK